MEDYQPTLLDKALIALDHYQQDLDYSGIILRVDGEESLPIWLMEDLANMGYEYASLNIEGEHNDLVHWKPIEAGEYAFPIIIIEDKDGEESSGDGHRSKRIEGH